MYDSSKYPYTIREADIYTKLVLLDMWEGCHNEIRKANFVGSFIGNMGDGKSLGIITHAWLVDVDPKTEEHRFTIDKFHFGLKPFVHQIRNAKYIGEAFALDEMELKGHARQSFSFSNEILGDIFSTMRSRRQILLYSLPSERQLDSQLRTLRTARFHFEGVYAEGYSKFIYHRLKPNVRFAEGGSNIGDTIANVPRIELDDRSIKVLKYNLHLPNCEPFRKIVKEYAIKKDEYLDNYYDNILARIDSVPEGEEDNKSIYQIVNEIEANIDNYVDPLTNNINPLYLVDKLGVSQTKANTIYRALKSRKSNTSKFEKLDVSEINHNYKVHKKRLQRLADIYS